MVKQANVRMQSSSGFTAGSAPAFNFLFILFFLIDLAQLCHQLCSYKQPTRAATAYTEKGKKSGNGHIQVQEVEAPEEEPDSSDPEDSSCLHWVTTDSGQKGPGSIITHTRLKDIHSFTEGVMCVCLHTTHNLTQAFVCTHFVAYSLFNC